MSEADAIERIQRFRTARAHWLDEPSEVPIRSYTLPQPIGSKVRAERVYLTDDDLCDLLNGYALAAARVVELEGERQQLADRVERADQTIANSAEIVTARDARIRELEARWRAIRSWTRSNLQTLDSAQRDWRQSSENAAKQAVLGDLSRCLEHLTEPQPAAAPDRAEGNEQ